MNAEVKACLTEATADAERDRWCDDREEVVALYDALRAHGFGELRRGDSSGFDALVRDLLSVPWRFSTERAHVRAEQHMARDCWICLDRSAVDECDCAGCAAVKAEQIKMAERCERCGERMMAGECQTPTCPEFAPCR